MTWFRCGMKKSVDDTVLNSVIDRSVTSIKYNGIQVGYYIFYGCQALTNVELSSSIDSILAHAFDLCRVLPLIDLKSVRLIQNNVFSSCAALETVILRRSTMTQLANTNAFTGTPFGANGTGGTLYVPNDLITTYQADATWAAVLGANVNNQILAIEDSPYEEV